VALNSDHRESLCGIALGDDVPSWPRLPGRPTSSLSNREEIGVFPIDRRKKRRKMCPIVRKCLVKNDMRLVFSSGVVEPDRLVWGAVLAEFTT